MKTIIYTIILAFFGLQLSFAQVGIGTTTPDQSAALEVQSTEKGMLIPRMDSLQRINIQTPATGLMVYQTDQTSGFYYYDGTSWVSLSSITPSGLEAINTAAPVGIPDLPVDGSGLVKINRPIANYGTVGYEAVDLSFSYTADNTLGATGPGSLATGVETTASGGASTAFGNGTVASGEDSSTAMGSRTTASGDNATAMGFETTASGFSSTSMGRSTTAESYSQTTLGLYNVPTAAIDAEDFDALDRVVVVGNGTNIGSESDALVILKNGTITAPSFDIAEITEDKALITKEYADANLENSGLQYIDETDDINDNGGLVRVLRDAANYGNIGFSALDLSKSNTVSTTLGATAFNSTAIGFETTASGAISTAMGQNTTASGFASIASGYVTTASGNYSTTTGYVTTASGFASIASGFQALASGDYSTTTGYETTASGFASMASGFQTLASGNLSYAFGGGTLASGSEATAMGTNSVASGNQSFSFGTTTVSSGNRAIAMGSGTQADAFNSMAIGRYNIGGGTNNSWVATDALFEVGNGSTVSNRSNALTILKNGNATLAGNLTENSDFRLKKNIQPLENSLVKLLKLEGKNYYWNNLKPHSKDLQIGLIAQDLETVFPELVHTGSDGYKSVDYTSLIPVIIEATKSQQEIIETQNKRIKALEEQNRKLLALEARLKALENDKNLSSINQNRVI